MWWFFGGCLVAAIVVGFYEYQFLTKGEKDEK